MFTRKRERCGWFSTNGNESLQPEQAMVLACARSALGADHVHVLRTLHKEKIDGEALRALAGAHGVLHFVVEHLHTYCDDNVWSSKALRDGVQEDLRRQKANALVLLDQQLRLAAVFGRCQIPHVWLKGLGLSQQLYGRPDGRVSSDLDLLVEGDRLPAVREQLQTLGWQRWHSPIPGKDFHALGSHHEAWVASLKNEWTVLLEVHHRLRGPAACQPPAAAVVRRSRLIALSGQAIHVPALNDELLILCLHAHHHNFGPLSCVMDVAEYVKKYRSQLDWNEFLRAARESRAAGRVLAALEIAHRLSLRQSERDEERQFPRPTFLQRHAMEDLSWNNLLAVNRHDDDFCRLRYALLMDRWSDAFRLLGPHLLPSTEYARATCPAWVRRRGLARAYHLGRMAAYASSLLFTKLTGSR